jgi:hypothetical protein
MKFTNIRVGDTVRYKGTLYEVVDSYNGKFGIMRTDIDERHVLWAEASQLIKVLDKEEFGEKYPEE